MKTWLLMNSVALPVFAPPDPPKDTTEETEENETLDETSEETEQEAPEWQERLDAVATQIQALTTRLEAKEAAEAEAKANGSTQELEQARAATAAAEAKLVTVQAELDALKALKAPTPRKKLANPANGAGARPAPGAKPSRQARRVLTHL